MSKITIQKSIFEMSPEEFEAHVTPRSIELRDYHWSKGGYVSCPARNDFKPNHFVHIYKDNRITLTELNSKTGKSLRVTDQKLLENLKLFYPEYTLIDEEKLDDLDHLLPQYR